ncbi:MAG: hypothetical protein GX434_17150 [Peptococcaceae bacterium]|nr:hypothetical protein [Peptococcaceae bacterium]
MALSGDDATSATVAGLFDDFPIDRITSVGVSNGFWSGAFGGVSNGAALLTTAQLFDNTGTAVGVAQLEVRIPFNLITFVV